jgi:hypothetical protein
MHFSFFFFFVAVHFIVKKDRKKDREKELRAFFLHICHEFNYLAIETHLYFLIISHLIFMSIAFATVKTAGTETSSS